MHLARFEGGPYDGTELSLAGKIPGYLLLAEPPEEVGWSGPLIVGADFDDDWPGQQRYELEPTWHVAQNGRVVTYTHIAGEP